MSKIVRVNKKVYVDKRPVVKITAGGVVTAVAAGVAIALLTRD